MPPSIKFNLKALDDLSTDLRESKKSLPLIIRKVLFDHLRPIRNQLQRQIPRSTGRLRRTFFLNVSKRRAGRPIRATMGFSNRRTVPASAKIAGNVLQHPGANPGKGKYLWIPFVGNRNADGSPMIAPRDLLDTGGFVRPSKAGNMMAFRRTGPAKEDIVPMFILKTRVQFKQAPIPFAARVEAAVPAIVEDIPELVAQVIEAKKAALNTLT